MRYAYTRVFTHRGRLHSSPGRAEGTIERMNLSEDLVLSGRLLAALVLSSTIGLERELTHKSVGLRTHVLVGVSSALFVTLAELMVKRFTGMSPFIKLDPIAVLGAVVSGISFLGAGAIFSSNTAAERRQGLTSAASILGTAGIGITCGLTHYLLALIVTVFYLLTLRGMKWLENRLTIDNPPP